MTRSFLLPLLLLCGTAACGAQPQQEKAVAQATSAPTVVAAADLPVLTGRVVDDAAILSDATEARISAELARLEGRTRDQFVLVTTPGLGARSIEEFGLALGNAWGVGQRELDNGVLLIIAPNDRKVRIEVGYGLEGLLTDELAASIIENDLLPRLKRGAFDEAATGGVERIIAILDSDVRRPLRKRREG